MTRVKPAKIMLTFVLLFAVVGASVVGALYLSLYLRSTPEGIPRHTVGERVYVSGEIVEVQKQSYAIIIKLRVFRSSDPSRVMIGSVINVQFTGIGDVTTWRSRGLESGDRIRGYITWVENTYWEMVDSEWHLG